MKMRNDALMNGALMSRDLVIRALSGTIAAVTVAALVIVAAPNPAFAQDAEQLAYQENLATVGEAGFEVAPHAVPVTETTVGHGDVPGSGAETRVSLGAAAAETRSALVRITLLAPQQDTMLFTGADAAPLAAVTAGSTASTTVLLPVDEAGTVSLWSDAVTPLRIEPLAFFTGGADAPGATIAVEAPERRVSLEHGLGVVPGGSGEFRAGLVGKGSVPATGVRSVYLTVDVTLAQSDEVVLGDGQRVPVPAGRTVFTTVVTPDERGGTELEIASGAAPTMLTADVTGWVAEVVANSTRANGAGSYIPETGDRDPLQLDLAAGSPVRAVEVTDHGDLDYALMLVSGESGRDTHDATVVQWADRSTGRAQGTAIDPQLGAAPQLALVPVTDERIDAAIRRGETTMQMQTLGGFLAADPETTHSGDADAELDITGYSDGDTVDISQTGSFRLTGTAAIGQNAIDRIVIGADRFGLIGTAELNYDGNGATWQIDLTAPETGTYTYSAQLYERGRSAPSAEAEITLEVVIPDDDGEVVAPNVSVMNSNGASDFTLSAENDRVIIFDADPGLLPEDFVIGDVSEATPDGFLGAVLATDIVEGRWHVLTRDAGIDEFILQADIDETHEVDADEAANGAVTVLDAGVSVEDSAELYEGDITLRDDADVELASGEIETTEGHGDGVSEPSTQLMIGPDVDLELDPAHDVAPELQDQVQLTCALEGTSPEPEGADIAEDGTWTLPSDAAADPSTNCGNDDLEWSGGASFSAAPKVSLLFERKNGKFNVQDQSGHSEEQKQAEAESAFHANFGIQLDAKAEISFKVELELDVKLRKKFGFIPTGVTLNKFSVMAGYKFKSLASVSAYVEGSMELDMVRQLSTISLPTLRFMMGVVPVIITNKIDVAFALEGTIGVKATFPVIGYERASKVGYARENGQWHRINESETPKTMGGVVSGLPGELEVAASGELSIGPSISFKSSIYGLAGPKITAGVGVGAAVELEATFLSPDADPLKLAVEVYLQFQLKGEANLTLLRWELLKATLFDIKAKLVLWESEWVLIPGPEKHGENSGSALADDPTSNPDSAPDPTPDPAPDADADLEPTPAPVFDLAT